MDYKFYLIDDDVSVLHMLTRIILDQKLGDVVGKNDSGTKVRESISELKPDVVLIDLLLPVRDGIAIVRDIKKLWPNLPIVMISEVQAKDLIAKAYDEGIEFFINKPINVREVVSVIQRIDEKLKLKAVVDSFQTAFQSFQALENGYKVIVPEGGREAVQQRAMRILSDLGISTESGAKDLLNMVIQLDKEQKIQQWTLGDWTLSDLFHHMSQSSKDNAKENVAPRTIEQRIRRTISAAMHHLAHFGLEDFEHELMYQYARTYFDFGEVRNTMRYIEKKQKEEGKVNVKKFIVAYLQDVFR